MSLISEARMEGRHARRDGVARTNCPTEFRYGAQIDGDWLRGWDFEDRQIRVRETRSRDKERNAA